MTRLSSLLAFDAAAAFVSAAGATLAIRAHRTVVRSGDAAPGATGLRIAGTMIMALGLAGVGFATMYHFSVS